MTKNNEADELEYATSHEDNIAILRELGLILFRERLPLIIAGVTQNLIDAGVDFSKARLPEDLTLSDDEWRAIYNDFR